MYAALKLSRSRSWVAWYQPVARRSVASGLWSARTSVGRRGPAVAEALLHGQRGVGEQGQVAGTGPVHRPGHSRRRRTCRPSCLIPQAGGDGVGDATVGAARGGSPCGDRVRALECGPSVPTDRIRGGSVCADGGAVDEELHALDPLGSVAVALKVTTPGILLSPAGVRLTSGRAPPDWSAARWAARSALTSGSAMPSGSPLHWVVDAQPLAARSRPPARPSGEGWSGPGRS